MNKIDYVFIGANFYQSSFWEQTWNFIATLISFVHKLPEICCFLFFWFSFRIWLILLYSRIFFARDATVVVIKASFKTTSGVISWQKPVGCSATNIFCVLKTYSVLSYNTNSLFHTFGRRKTKPFYNLYTKKLFLVLMSLHFQLYFLCFKNRPFLNIFFLCKSLVSVFQLFERKFCNLSVFQLSEYFSFNSFCALEITSCWQPLLLFK